MWAPCAGETIVSAVHTHFDRRSQLGSMCECIQYVSVCVALSVYVFASKYLLQDALWQDVSHRSHTGPDYSSHYNIRGYPLIWKPSNHGPGRTIGTNYGSDVDGSITVQALRGRGGGRNFVLDSKL